MSFIDTIGTPKHRLTDVIISEVLMREAVRGLTENRPRYSGAIGKSIAFFRNYLQRERVVANGGLPFLQDGIADIAYAPNRRRYSTGLVETDPFVLDGFDLLKLLMHFDSDQAKDLNYVGFSRSASPIAHTIYSFFDKGYSVHRDTMVTLTRIIGKHLKQAARHLAKEVDLDSDQIEQILTERTDLWKSPRIWAKITLSPTPVENLNYLFVMGDTIQVHMGRAAPRIGKMLAQYTREILKDDTLGPLAKKLFKERGGRSGSGTKMFGGEAISYTTSLFPLHPTAARELIEHIEAYDPNALIDHSVRVLAKAAVDYGQHPSPRPGRR